MKITKKLIAKFLKAINAWKENKETKDLKAVYAEDRVDLMCIYNLCKEGNLKQAASMANQLDTIVRDVIPEDLYEAIFENY